MLLSCIHSHTLPFRDTPDQAHLSIFKLKTYTTDLLRNVHKHGIQYVCYKFICDHFLRVPLNS